MLDIKVLGYSEVIACVDSGWPTHIISLLNKPLPFLGPQHLHLMFDDVSVPTLRDYVTPLVSHMLQVFAFTTDLTSEDRVLIHCFAGISRSTAMAIGVLIQHGMDCQDAYNQIAAIRPQLAPNRLIIQYIDEHFALDKRLIRLVAQHYSPIASNSCASS